MNKVELNFEEYWKVQQQTVPSRSPRDEEATKLLPRCDCVVAVNTAPDDTTIFALNAPLDIILPYCDQLVPTAAPSVGRIYQLVHHEVFHRPFSYTLSLSLFARCLNTAESSMLDCLKPPGNTGNLQKYTLKCLVISYSSHGYPHYTSRNTASKKISQDVDVQKTKPEKKALAAQISSGRNQDDTHYAAVETNTSRPGDSPSGNSKKLLNRRRNISENRIADRTQTNNAERNAILSRMRNQSENLRTIKIFKPTGRKLAFKNEEDRLLFEKQRTVIYALNAIMRDAEHANYEAFIQSKHDAKEC
ncbi:hypothetical protein X801_04478 [Opisthorchis viverrini]|uniref:Uncharacterized protein n=2 Tax=Opisthorchis viverrini TaxID=6198 RepID=A0A075A1C1_OPIVI|nr:hypothetical protein T265_10462 [Opisthorchis viverrini]KER21154.1 hypothetical protein T265_10462 [Opisthorchis viverrini]OON19654.1 hypothetical protein X801_04478 [Opisthorchis viverrini]